MKYRLILILFCSLFILLSAEAQPSRNYTSRNKKAISYFEKSTNFFIRRQFGPALELLNAAVRKDGDFAEAHFRLSKIYQMMGNAPEMRHHLQKVVRAEYDNPTFAEAHSLLAQEHFAEGDYEKARELAEHVRNMPRAHQIIKDDCRYLLENIDFTEENIDKPVAFSPRPVEGGVNQMPLQYFPVLTVDQQTMIFTARVGLGPQYDEDIYISRKGADGRWSRPESLSDNINGPANEGTSTITADGRTLIFTACQDRRGYGSCDLYISTKTGDRWSVPKNLGKSINSRAWESQPTLSADGRTLYFVSDRSGGVGRRDIYISRLQEDGTWCQAENLGKAINTPRDEVSPFIHVNGQTLYFASDGLPGFGKFDLYMSEKAGDSWSQPVNLGYPINTREDQASLFITADGKDAYYSYEKRQGERYVSSTIYTFEIPEAIRVRNRSSFVEGIVYDAETREPIKASVELVDLQQQESISAVESDPVNGEYLMVLTEGARYGLYVDKEAYLFQSLTFDYAEDQGADVQEPLHIDIYLQPIIKGKETVLNNIFFDVDKYEIKAISEPELNKIARFMEENPDIRIAINGHTDNQGSEAYNKELSTKRAKAVFDYLLSAGISEERLEYRGYGQSKPIASNETEAGRQENRRIAFEIL